MARPISTIAVVGAGYMGSGIAQVLAMSGRRCTLLDVDAETAERAYQKSVTQATEFERLSYFPAGAADRIRENTMWSGDIGDVGNGTDLVVEAVSEDENVKLSVLTRLEDHVRQDTVLASNTSSIPIKNLAAPLKHPERMYGIHWFNPAQFLPSVEVIEGPQANPEVTHEILELLRSAGRSPVVVADSPGFIANRLQFALFREASLMVDEGLAEPEQIDEVVRGSFGYRLPFFGPFMIADIAGLDVYAAVFDVLERSYGARFSCPPGLRRLVDDGRLGAKTGRGYRQLVEPEWQAVANARDRAYVTMAAALKSWSAAMEESETM